MIPSGLLNGLGFAGVSLLIGTYLMLQMGWMRVERLPYSVFNAIGAGLILLSLTVEPNKPSILIEVFWMLVSLLGVVRILSRRRRGPIEPEGTERTGG